MDTMQQPLPTTPPPVSKKVPDIEEKAEKLAQDLQINLSGRGLYLPFRIIALFTLVGGMSLIGSMFADILNPAKTNIGFYFERLIVGLLIIGIAYGIITVQRWALWLYGMLTLFALLVNPIVAIVPAMVVVYLYFQRSKLQPSIFDRVLGEMIASSIRFIRQHMQKNPPSEQFPQTEMRHLIHPPATNSKQD